MRTRTLGFWVLAAVAAWVARPHAAAFTSQVDGIPVPQEVRLQACLDRTGTGELTAGAINAIMEAAVLPEVFRPVETSPGEYPVRFRMIGEGAGFRNTFGYFWTDEDVTDPDNLHMVFECRPTDGTSTYGSTYDGSMCGCPCDPDGMRPLDGTPYAWDVTVDFEDEPGFAPGRGIGMWIRTEQRFTGSNNETHCDVGGPGGESAQDHRTYYTSKALNDDGDFVHFLVYRSADHANTFYFGFEDLFRGGDNDFEDVLVRTTGLVPLCDPVAETCNNADDDCDQIVDEGITQACSTACGDGIRTCAAGVFGDCSAADPTTETCNNVDDNCNTQVDEGLSQPCSSECGSGTEVCVAGAFVDCNAPTPGIEDCDNTDDDCDGSIDEMISRACFTACGSGVETCTAGTFGGCTAPEPIVTETCNAEDDDCDGLTDEGLTRACSSTCGSGTETCISGSWVGCNALSPALEACNNIDDDCDASIDELLSRTCSSACGTGTENCSSGLWIDCDAPEPGTEICNNIDDDCNGVIDDGNPGGGGLCLPDLEGSYTVVTTDNPDDTCIPGIVTCVAGELLCLGATSPTREICNCEDDDCDGLIDETTTDSICPGGACIDCDCVSPCADSEFPCPPGRVCDESYAEPPDLLGYCLPGQCEGVECTEEERCNPLTGECDDLCASISCASTHTCIRGTCVEDNCYGRGCDAGETCVEEACEPDPCHDIDCGEESFCRDGECVAKCPDVCPDGQICQGSECIDEPCGGNCTASESCVDELCVMNSCVPPCGSDRTCVASVCVDDPCAAIECPEETSCHEGDCFVNVPREQAYQVLATGGGGCTCQTAGASSTDARSPQGLALALLVAAFLLISRRSRGASPSLRQARRTPRAPLAVLVMGGIALPTSGCDVDPFCITNCGDERQTADANAGSADAGSAIDGTVDGCVPTGEEQCNELDDDCNGIVDDGFDLSRDLGNCGMCGRECILPHAFPSCDLGECVIEQCEIGWVDLNGSDVDGCEYECLNSGGELCDEIDNDCNGETDEGFDLTSDLGNCGECGNLCTFANAVAACEASICTMGDCNAGFVNENGGADDGCEYACTPGGSESCNGVDDDCDQLTDEGYDLLTDPSHCGVCGRVCSFPNVLASCTGGICGFDPETDCETNFYDIDGDPVTGCEYPCTYEAAVDDCDMSDNDCDGIVDEDDPTAGTDCGVTTGSCDPGSWTCVLGSLVCIGGIGATPETCNTFDDDCDGTVDESTLLAPIPGVGQRCGETNVGACVYGEVECSSGLLACGGAYVAPAGAETCDGVDEDCDGTIDDAPTAPGSPPASCAEERGVCAGRDAACTGAGGWQCADPANYQAIETICDGLNNDCDDNTDEGCLAVVGVGDIRLDSGDTAGDNNSVQPTLGGDGGDYVFAAFMDLRVPVPDGDDDDSFDEEAARIFFNRSTDGGDTWLGTDARIDTGLGAAIGPRLAVSSPPGVSTDVTTLWSDFRSGVNYREIYTRHSTDALASFAATDHRLNVGQNEDSFALDIAVVGTNVYAVYESFTAVRSRHLFFLYSTDGGSTWVNDDSPIQIDHGTGTTLVAAEPRIAAVGSNVFVVWRDNRNGGLDVYTNRSTDGGATWGGTDVRLDLGTTAGASSSFEPAIAAEGTNVYAAWVDDRSGTSFDIYFNRSTDSGATWLASAVELDNDPIAHESIRPQIATVGSGEAVFAWVDYRSGFPDIISVRTADAGATFGSPTRLDTGEDPGATSSLELALGANGDLVVAVWSDDRGGFFDIYANFSVDGGLNWQPNDYRLDSTTSNHDSVHPRLYVAPGAAHVVWEDFRSGSAAGKADIYYRRLE